MSKTLPLKHLYLISCSKASNSAVEKNSLKVISRPSHNFFSVLILGSLLFPYKIFLIDEGGKADLVASSLIVMSRSAHSCSILSLIASVISIEKSALFFIGYQKNVEIVGYICYYQAIYSLQFYSKERMVRCLHIMKILQWCYAALGWKGNYPSAR